MKNKGFVTVGLLLLSPGLAVPARGQIARQVPSEGYFNLVGTFRDGDFARAYRGFKQVAAGRIPGREPLELVCYHAMAGECLYQMGDLAAAQEQYTAALRALQSRAGWLIVPQYPELMPDETAVRPPITWGVKTRRTGRARLPDQFIVPVSGIFRLGQTAGGQRALVGGGSSFNLRGLEVLRCAALALRRRAELLGPLAPYDPLTEELVAQFARRQAPPNHWSQSWISLQLGLAHIAAGRTPEAVGELQASLLVAGMDHPLTCVALLELGKLALHARQLDQAAVYFQEAAISAAEFGQVEVLCESFQQGMLTHVMRGEKSLYPPLAPAAQWARRLSRLLEICIAATTSENLAAIGRSPEALAMAEQAYREIGRRSIGSGAIGAQLQYQMALAGYQLGRGPAADQALAAALQFFRKGSHWSFQLTLADQLYTSGAIGRHVADQLYEVLLRDPTAQDWLYDPAESLASLMAPHELAVEHWFELAVQREELEKALEISDLARRRRFFASLPLGGRLLALRWIAEAPDETLSDEGRLQRQHLLNTRPQYTQLSQQAAQLRAQLSRLPLEPAADKQKEQVELLEELGRLSAAQELMLRAMALDRVPSELMFPPRADVKGLQQRLKPGQALLSYFSTRSQVYAIAISADKYGAWTVEQPRAVRANLTALLKAIGCQRKSTTLRPDDLDPARWQPLLRTLQAQLLPPLAATEAGRADRAAWDALQELIIVPDGVLWYMPFELLPAGEDESQRLIDQKRIRYVPLVSLSLPGTRHRTPDVKTAVVAGKVLPDEIDEDMQAHAERLSKEVPRLSLVDRLPAPSSLLAPFWHRLIVYADLVDSMAGAHVWSPAERDRGKPGSSLAAWLELPWGGPYEVLLPGFHSHAESALSKGGDGRELFLAACGLMATGTRTALISRWPVGGQSTRELMREFVQELPYLTAAQAWQRSVQLLRISEIDPAQEPRVGTFDRRLPADHPLFWAGYLLIDMGDERK